MSHQIALAIGGLAPMLLFAMALWYRDSSAWIRRLFFTSTVVGALWASLGFVHLYHIGHFTNTGWLRLERAQTSLAGAGIGLIVSAFLSADFWKLVRHYHFWYGLTNRSSRPTTSEKT